MFTLNSKRMAIHLLAHWNRLFQFLTLPRTDVTTTSPLGSHRDGYECTHAIAMLTFRMSQKRNPFIKFAYLPNRFP
jgi:hypothetical protein